MTCKFQVGQTYKTIGGYDTIVYAVYPDQMWSIHGAYFVEGVWIASSWRYEGSSNVVGLASILDLIPPRETVTMWVNVYPKLISQGFSSRGMADRQATRLRIAVWRVTYDATTGEHVETVTEGL